MREEWPCHYCLAHRFKTVTAIYRHDTYAVLCSRCRRERQARWLRAAMRKSTPAAEREDLLAYLHDLEFAYPRNCTVCGRWFAWIGRPATMICSAECERERRNQPRRVSHPERPCVTCGEPFTPKRTDALYCSGRCRTAAYRARGL